MIQIFKKVISQLTDNDIETLSDKLPYKFADLKNKSGKAFEESVTAWSLLCENIENLNDSSIFYNEYKKPYIGDGIYFSISHDYDLVVVAIGDEDVGVDVVYKNRLTDEQFNLLSKKIPAKDKEEFIKKWAIYESAGKLIGIGLKPELFNFNVNIESETQKILNYEVITDIYDENDYVICVSTFKK